MSYQGNNYNSNYRRPNNNYNGNNNNNYQNRTITVPEGVVWVAKHVCIPKKVKGNTKEENEILKDLRKDAKKSNQVNYYDELKHNNDDISDKKIFIMYYEKIMNNLAVTCDWILKNLRTNEASYIIEDAITNISDTGFMKYFIRTVKSNLKRKDANKVFYKYLIIIAKAKATILNNARTSGLEFPEDDQALYDDVIEILLPKKYEKAKDKFPNINNQFIKQLYIAFPYKDSWTDPIGRTSRFVEIRRNLYKLSISDLINLDVELESVHAEDDMIDAITDSIQEFLEYFIPDEYMLQFIRNSILESRKYYYGVVNKESSFNTWTMLDRIILREIEKLNQEAINELLSNYVDARSKAEVKNTIDRRIDFTAIDHVLYPKLSNTVQSMINNTNRERSEKAKRYLCI